MSTAWVNNFARVPAQPPLASAAKWPAFPRTNMGRARLFPRTWDRGMAPIRYLTRGFKRAALCCCVGGAAVAHGRTGDDTGDAHQAPRTGGSQTRPRRV